jgi:hypothetical protein
MKNRRAAPRRLPRGGTKVTCLKGTLGLGKNLARALLDISETGMRLVLNSAVNATEDIEVTLLGPGQSRSVKAVGEVIWCVGAADGTFCVGVRFHKRLRYMDFQTICR